MHVIYSLYGYFDLNCIYLFLGYTILVYPLIVTLCDDDEDLDVILLNSLPDSRKEFRNAIKYLR